MCITDSWLKVSYQFIIYIYIASIITVWIEKILARIKDRTIYRTKGRRDKAVSNKRKGRTKYYFKSRKRQGIGELKPRKYKIQGIGELKPPYNKCRDRHGKGEQKPGKHRRQGEQKPRMHRRQDEQKLSVHGRQGEQKPRKHSRQGTGEPKPKYNLTNVNALNNIVYNTSFNETNIENHWDQETYPIAIDSAAQ